jgi:hypothetical protein
VLAGVPCGIIHKLDYLKEIGINVSGRLPSINYPTTTTAMTSATTGTSLFAAFLALLFTQRAHAINNLLHFDPGVAAGRLGILVA